MKTTMVMEIPTGIGTVALADLLLEGSRPRVAQR